MLSRTGKGGYEDLLARRSDLVEVDAASRAEGKSEQEVVADVVRAIQKGRC
jgi:hypothetical protein